MLNSFELKRYRLHRGVSQGDVAKFGGMSTAMVSYLENGERPITTENFRAYVDGVNRSYEAKKRGELVKKKLKPKIVTSVQKQVEEPKEEPKKEVKEEPKKKATEKKTDDVAKEEKPKKASKRKTTKEKKEDKAW